MRCRRAGWKKEGNFLDQEILLSYYSLLRSECHRYRYLAHSGGAALQGVSCFALKLSLHTLQQSEKGSSKPLWEHQILQVSHSLHLQSLLLWSEYRFARSGRQIDGLGGGVSSLSKVAIIGAPGEGMKEQMASGRLPGVEWADEGERSGKSWDLGQSQLLL